MSNVINNESTSQSLSQKIHRFPKVWLLATAVIVTASLVVAGVYVTKALRANNDTTTNTSEVTPDEPQSELAKTTAELKDIDLAELKASINEVKAVLNSFSN